MVRRSLKESGWDRRAVQRFVEEYVSIQRGTLPRATRIERVRALLGMRRVVKRNSWTEVVEVPLYRFGAPPVLGAKVEYSEGETLGDGSGWSIKFRGVGLGSTTNVQIKRTNTHTATDGAWQLVYVPVLVRITEVEVYDGEALVGRGHEAVAVPANESNDPLLQRRGVRAIDSVTGAAGGGDTIDFYDSVELDVANDNSGEVHKMKRGWEIDVARELTIPLSALCDVSALVKIKRVRSLELAFELPSGHHYRAYLCRGFTHWESPREILVKEKRTRKRDTAA
jgi:hypothetical protein